MPEPLEQYHFDDLCADLASAIEQKGGRLMAMEFEMRYPQHYQELKLQMQRLENTSKVAALLKPKAIKA